MIMNEQLIEKHIFESKHVDITKSTKTSNLFLSVLLILAGIVSFFLYGQLEKVSAKITLTLLVLAICLLILGIYILIWKSKTLVYQPTGSKILKNSTFFNINEQNKLVKMIKSGDFSSGAILSDEKGSIRLDYLISEDGQFAAVQLFQFSTYKFIAETPITYFQGEKAGEVSAFLKQFN